MEKTTKILIALAVIIAIVAIAGIVISLNAKTKTNLDSINSAKDLSALVDKIYEGQGDNVLPSLQTQTIDTTDDMTVKMVTGLENANDIEYLVVSEPMITSQAYSMVLAKVKEGVDANQIAKLMSENVDQSKWICVTAEKVYATSSGDIIFLVMSDEKEAKSMYDKFKTLAGNIGQEYEKTAEEIELPPEMY